MTMLAFAVMTWSAAFATPAKGLTTATALLSTLAATGPMQATTSTMGPWSSETAYATAHTKQDIFAIKYDKFEGRVIPDAGLYYENVSSKITCLSYCATDRECMSFFYIKATQSCRLHTIVYISQNDTVKSDSASYYIVGDKNKCPIDEGFFHKRSLNACYYVVTDRANLTAAVRTCSEKDAQFGYPFSSDLYDHFNDVLTGSFLFRKREFWTGIVLEDGHTDYKFYSDNSIPNFSRWKESEPSGHLCVVTSLEDNWQWESTGCDRSKAYVCSVGIW